MSTWICNACIEEIEGVSIGDLKRAGAYTDALDPDVECSRCGARPSEAVRLRLTIERLALAQAVPREVAARPDAGAPTPAPVSSGALYSLREVARALHLDRSGKLARAVEAELVSTVLVGRARRVPGEELLRLLREGLPELPDARTPPAPKQRRQRRRAPKSNGAAGSIAKIPL